MFTRCFCLVHAVLFVVFATATPTAFPQTRGATKIELFNGKDLEGWTTASGGAVGPGWTVENGILTRGEKEAGTIYTLGEYENFILDFDWKLADGGNSGVKYRVRFYEHGVHDKPGWLGLEYQLLDDVHHPSADVFATSTGSLYALFDPGPGKRLNPPSEFNHSRIVVCGNRIEHWLNGRRIVAVDTRSEVWRERIAASKFSPAEGFGENRKGRIEIQDHGSQVWFGSMTLTPIVSKPIATLASRRRTRPGLLRRLAARRGAR